jgi:hypothetical protein
VIRCWSTDWTGLGVDDEPQPETTASTNQARRIIDRIVVA